MPVVLLLEKTWQWHGLVLASVQPNLFQQIQQNAIISASKNVHMSKVESKQKRNNKYNILIVHHVSRVHRQ